MEALMVTAQSLWKRIETVFRRHGDDFQPAISAANLKVVTETAEPRPQPSRFRLPWGRGARAALEERYQRVSQAMEALDRHFDQQDRRAAQLVGAVEHVARNLADLSDQNRRNHDTLASINQQLTVVARHAGNCTTAFVELPAAMQAQADAVRTIGRQMESLRGTQTELGGSLKTFATSVDSLRDAGVSQVESLERLHLESYDDRRALQHLLRTQQQRFLIVMLVTAGIAVAAIVACAAFLATALPR
jgi:prefoldin subunit 5